MYRDSSLKLYLDDLAAKLPAPGGGSAAALTAALGQALVSMVINFTLGKVKYAQFEKDLTIELEKSEKLRREFLDLVDRDVEAYNSKDPRKALDIPVMVARLCFEGIKAIPDLIKKVNSSRTTTGRGCIGRSARARKADSQEGKVNPSATSG